MLEALVSNKFQVDAADVYKHVCNCGQITKSSYQKYEN